MADVVCSSCGKRITAKKDLAGCRGILDFRPMCRKCYHPFMEKERGRHYVWYCRLAIVATVLLTGVFLLVLLGILAVLWMGVPLSPEVWALILGFILFCLLALPLSIGGQHVRLYLKYGRHLK